MKYVKRLPGKQRTNGYTPYDRDLAQELTEHRGEWAVIRSGTASSIGSTASMINNGHKPNLPPALYEAAARNDGTGWKLYIRRRGTPE